MKTEPDFTPAYLALSASDRLSLRDDTAQAHLEHCDLCAHYCHINRRKTITGAVCRTGEQAAVTEMHRQVGDLVLDSEGIAQRGLLVRHLVLPQQLAGTERVLAFLVEEISPHTYLNLMDQYHSCYRAYENPPLDRSIN
jgi:uncharacterized Fe-S radical SAM superfamily protein PflX